MATDAVSTDAIVERPGDVRNPKLRISRYDQVSGMLLALLVIVGTMVLILFAIWISQRIFVSQVAVNVELVQPAGGGLPDGTPGESMQIDAPEWHEVHSETDISEQSFQDTVATVLDAAATQEADITEQSDTEVQEEGGMRSKLTGTGTRPGLGYGDGPPGIPPHLRWKIQYSEGATMQAYEKILDFFEIELCVVARGRLTYVRNVSQGSPAVRVVEGGEKDNRLYFNWQSGALMSADSEIARKAGVQPTRKIVHCYSKELEQLLLTLEYDFKKVEPAKVRLTRFGIRPAGQGFEFYVIDQVPL